MHTIRVALMLLLLAIPAARADDATPDAASVQAQLRAALGPFGGDGADVEKQVRVTQDGDHLKIALPYYALMGMTPADPGQDSAITASARMTDGKWDIEDIQTPSPLSLKVGRQDTATPGRMTITRGDQNGHALFDPTLKSDSSLSIIVHKVSSEMLDGQIRQAQRIDTYTIQAGIAPRGDGRLDFNETFDASNWAIAMQLPDKTTLEIAMERANLSGRLDRLNQQRTAPLLALMSRLNSFLLTRTDPADHALPRMDPATSQDFAAALDDLAAGGKLDEQAYNIRVVADGKRGSADHVSLGFGAEAPDGQLGGYVDIVVDGLALPDQPEAAPYVPRHLALRPSISGIDMHMLTELIRSAAAPGPDKGALMIQAMGLLASGRLKIGIDSFALDMGEAQFGGTGTLNVRAPSPDGIDGVAHVTAEHFDAFVRQMQAGKDPRVAGAIPTLIYAKGLARDEGGKLVWDVALSGGKLTVNGIDPIPKAEDAAPAKPPGPSPSRR